MAEIFISYTTADVDYALQLYRYFQTVGVNAWFAPCRIAGGQNFAEEIGKELGWCDPDDIMQTTVSRSENLDRARAVVVLLSKNAMQSPWVMREVTMAVEEGKLILVARLDHTPDTSAFRILLKNVQHIDAYHLPRAALAEIHTSLLPVLPKQKALARLDERMTYDELGIDAITIGDPYYTSEDTLRFFLRRGCFLLAPPAGCVPEERQTWAQEHFAPGDTLLNYTWEQLFSAIPITDLPQRIAASRQKVFLQFLNQENGCYYNNKKYGIYSIRPYGRTEDLSETPVLEIELYETDYFTHRVMKDVCKQLVAEQHPHFDHLNYVNLEENCIFFTSLGLNLLLLDSAYREEPCTILTERSTNAAETYQQQQYSVSVVEGVSLSDYDPYQKTVNITLAAYRGLQEELGVQSRMVKADSLRFYELFVNRRNLEMGLTCSIELDKSKSIEDDVLRCHGKDEMIEVAGKRLLPLKELKEFAFRNRDAFLPQALFTILSYYDAIGVPLLDRHYTVAQMEEAYLIGKDGHSTVCGDAISQSPHYIAVIDGATPKGQKLWNSLPGDVFVAQLLAQAVEDMDPNLTAPQAITCLNDRVTQAYREAGVDFAALPPEEQLQASVILYSVKRKEVWSFGDCKLRINARNIDHIKKIDQMLSDLRAFCIETRLAVGLPILDDDGSDYGRAQILPFLKKQMLFANTDRPFGYDVISGGAIRAENVKVYEVKTGDHIVLASDGYPVLFDTLTECEQYLRDALREDRACVRKLRGTKGVGPDKESYDDRSFISFVVR